MPRSWVLLAVLLVATGCKGSGTSAPTTDPFFGRTRIEPPRTGAVGGNLSVGPNPGYPPQTGPSMYGGANGPSSGGSVPSAITSAPPSGQSSSPSPNWIPAHPKTNPIPAAIPGNQGSPQSPSNGGFGSGNTGGFSSPKPGQPISGTGDRISIPLAARSEPTWLRDSVARSPSSTTGANGTGNSSSTMENKATLQGEPTLGSNGPGSTAVTVSPPPSSRPYLDPGSPSSLEGKERIVREIERTASGPGTVPRYAPSPGNNQSSGGSGSAPSASEKSVNIADLPESK